MILIFGTLKRKFIFIQMHCDFSIKLAFSLPFWIFKHFDNFCDNLRQDLHKNVMQITGQQAILFEII